MNTASRVTLFDKSKRHVCSQAIYLRLANKTFSGQDLITLIAWLDKILPVADDECMPEGIVAQIAPNHLSGVALDLYQA